MCETTVAEKLVLCLKEREVDYDNSDVMGKEEWSYLLTSIILSRKISVLLEAEDAHEPTITAQLRVLGLHVGVD